MARAVKVVIQGLKLDGEHGPFLWTQSATDKNMWVTVGVEEGVLKEPTEFDEVRQIVSSRDPEQFRRKLAGTFMMATVVMKRGGWRALSARFFSPEDEEAERSAQEPHKKEGRTEP